jgi:RNase H-fold protein (predicted Holliday junction resolvase)
MFKEKLEQITKLKVSLADERLSSLMAQHLPGGNKDVDSLAAQIILQNFLDRSKERG